MRLSNVQVVFADCYKKCMDARGDNSSPFHILKPMQAELNLCKASIEDVQLPMYANYRITKFGICSLAIILNRKHLNYNTSCFEVSNGLVLYKILLFKPLLDNGLKMTN